MNATHLALILTVALTIDCALAQTTLSGLPNTNVEVPTTHGTARPETPEILLSWTGNWDRYPDWDGRGDVYQIDGSSSASPHTVQFTPSTGFAVRIDSFDLDEWVGGGDTTVVWSISGSESGTLASGTWSDFNNSTDPSDLGGRTSFSPDVTGASGETLTLSFGQTGGDTTFLALDNLSFDQVALTATPLQLQVTRTGSTIDFSWNSRPGHSYDLLSSPDLSTPVSSWSVHADDTTPYQDIAANGSTTTLTAATITNPYLFFAIRERDRPAGTLRVLSWNIWTADNNFNKINEVVQTTQADIIGFQELSNVSATINSLKTATSQEWYAHGMIVSRFPIIDTNGNGAQIRISPQSTAWVFNIHFPAFPYQPYDLRDGTLSQNEAAVIAASERARGSQATNLVNTIKASGALAADLPVFVTGDFNEPSHLDWTEAAASATPRPYDLEVEYPASKKMTDLGLIDAFRAVWPDEVARPGYTWTPGAPPPNLANNEVHDRIDFIYSGGSGVTAIDAKTIGLDPNNPNTDIAIKNYPADHRAIFATFAIRNAAP